MTSVFRWFLAVALTYVAMPFPVLAQTDGYPNKPVRIISLKPWADSPQYCAASLRVNSLGCSLISIGYLSACKYGKAVGGLLLRPNRRRLSDRLEHS